MFKFNAKTNDKVKSVITSAYHNKTRVRIVYGDIETGKQWSEEYDVIGTIGRSTGVQPIPLLINNSRSMGGCGLLDHCIIKIVDIKTKRVLYQADNYKLPVLVKCESTHSDYMYDVYHNVNSENTLVARFKTEKQADSYINFQHCKVMRK